MSTRKRKADAEPSGNFGRKLRSHKEAEPGLSDEEKKQYTFKSPYRQKFSLPDKLIYYLAKNPITPYCHLKFITSAKLLFIWSRIIYVEKNNIYKCSIKFLLLHKQILHFRELQILVSDNENLEKVSFVENVIKNGDQTITSFETVFEAILCKKKLEIKLCRGEQHGIGNGTARKMIELLEDRKPLGIFSFVIKIENIPEEFEFQSFSQFLEVNKMKHEIDLSFADGISSSYKNGIEKFIEKIVDGQNRGPVVRTAVPFITFMGQDERNYRKLKNRRKGITECDRPCLARFCGMHRCHYVD
uniref:Uncharacterized protein n=1 Tax=Panagrolaimus davidi TaxID=227884 RepID=A0A914QJR2_9BILA